jgi:hypothetical protein
MKREQKTKPPKCRHDGRFAIVSGVLGDDETAMSEPQVLCMGCGALRFRSRAEWSPSLDECLAADRTINVSFPDGAGLLLHATNLTEGEVDDAGRAAFDRWVDVGGYGRRLLYGQLRADEIERAERDAAEHVARQRQEHDRTVQERFAFYGRRPA